MHLQHGLLPSTLGSLPRSRSALGGPLQHDSRRIVPHDRRRWRILQDPLRRLHVRDLVRADPCDFVYHGGESFVSFSLFVVMKERSSETNFGWSSTRLSPSLFIELTFFLFLISSSAGSLRLPSRSSSPLGRVQRFVFLSLISLASSTSFADPLPPFLSFPFTLPGKFYGAGKSHFPPPLLLPLRSLPH